MHKAETCCLISIYTTIFKPGITHYILNNHLFIFCAGIQPTCLYKALPIIFNIKTGERFKI